VADAESELEVLAERALAVGLSDVSRGTPAEPTKGDREARPHARSYGSGNATRLYPSPFGVPESIT
jgi:hypothetical protein